MILIAESGSTKTQWRLIHDADKISQSLSAGMNPYYQTDEELQTAINEGTADIGTQPLTNIYHYGAGCSSDNNRSRIVEAYKTVFPQADVEVNHDLIAAARALCGNRPGIACILGTGANSCLYDGQNIIENVPSLGYVIGDEGSGSHLGKLLLAAYLRGELSEVTKSRLEKRFDLSKDIILSNVYQKEMPIRYLAGFSKFIFRNLQDPQLSQLVRGAFVEFFERNIIKYTDYKEVPVHFTGSVAFYYGNILRDVAAEYGISLQRLVENPIAGLALYHQENMV